MASSHRALTGADAYGSYRSPAPSPCCQVSVGVLGAFESWPRQHRLGRYADSWTGSAPRGRGAIQRWRDTTDPSGRCCVRSRRQLLWPVSPPAANPLSRARSGCPTGSSRSILLDLSSTSPIGCPIHIGRPYGGMPTQPFRLSDPPPDRAKREGGSEMSEWSRGKTGFDLAGSRGAAPCCQGEG